MLTFDRIFKDPGDVLMAQSGGPDSAIIYYALVNEIVNRNLDIKVYHITVDTTNKPMYSKYAKKVIDFVETELNFHNYEHIIKSNVEVIKTDTMPIGYEEAIFELIIDTREKHENIKYIISGLSNSLPERFLTEEKYKFPKKYGKNLGYRDARRMSLEDREDKTEQNEWRSSAIHEWRSNVVYLPFINKDKRYVKQLYDQYGVTDTLFDITRSCSASIDQDRYNPDRHCGSCLFCFERKFAFGRL